MESKINSKIRMFLGLFATASIIIPQALLFAQEQDQVKKALFQHITEKIEQAKKRDIATLAPTLFGEMMQLYRQAERYYEKGERLAKIRSSLNEAQEKLKQAIETSKISAVALAKVLETRKQASQFEFIRKVAPKKFAQAERDYREAIRKAEKGDMRRARSISKRALKNYREATIQAFEKGPFKEIQTKLERIKKELPRNRYMDNAQRLAYFRRSMSKSKNQLFNIPAWVRKNLVDIMGIGNSLCTKSVQPQILDHSISVPAPGSLLSHPPIYYVAGNYLDVTLTIPNCTMISNVKKGGIELSSEYDPIEQRNADWEIRNYVSEPNNQQRITIRINIPNLGNGFSEPVDITVKSVIGNLTTHYEFTVAYVKEVKPVAAISISENELRNKFITNIYNRYGDDGSYTDSTTSQELYNPSYEGLDLRIEDDGIHFKWKVKANIPNFCDPTIKMDGRFHLEQDGGYIDVIWDEGPDVDIDIPLYCDIPASILTVPYILAKAFAASDAESNIRDDIQIQVDNLTNDIPPETRPFINFETHTDELVVKIHYVGDAVAIKVPYYAGLDVSGLALNPGDIIDIFPSALMNVCGNGSREPRSCSIKSGPAGLFNWQTNIPVPNPWPLHNGVYGYEKERHKAWRELQGLARQPDKLPLPQENAAALIYALEDRQPRMVRWYVRMEVPDSPEELIFGTNDYRSPSLSQYGTGKWRITIGWLIQ